MSSPLSIYLCNYQSIRQRRWGRDAAQVGSPYFAVGNSGWRVHVQNRLRPTLVLRSGREFPTLSADWCGNPLGKWPTDKKTERRPLQQELAFVGSAVCLIYKDKSARIKRPNIKRHPAFGSKCPVGAAGGAHVIQTLAVLQKCWNYIKCARLLVF